MLKIRLQRTGRNNEKTFRLVLTDSKNSTKSGRFLEVLGNHDFRKTNATAINAERVRFLISKGTKTTPTVHNLLLAQKVIDGKKINVLPRKSPPKKEEAPVEKKAEAAPVAPVATPAPAETPAA